jgi:hypothetical protein
MKAIFITLLLLCMSASAAAEVFNATKNQVLISPITAQREAETERLRQEQMRLENERLRQEIMQREREAQRREQERMRLQSEAREGERAQAEGTDQNTGPDIYEQLRTIGQLRDDGILTEEEFQGLKKKILEEHHSTSASFSTK